MFCIYCGAKTIVANSRPKQKIKQVWRRRTCSSCGRTFTTVEIVDFEKALSVNKGLGQIEPFSRDKLLLSVQISLGHRKTSQSDASALTDTIIAKLLMVSSGAMVDTKNIKAVSLEVLKRFDRAGATTYQAYHTSN